MKVVYYHYDGYDSGLYGFFTLEDKILKLLHWWHENDSAYRAEYMLPLFKKLGTDIKQLPKKHLLEARRILKEVY